MPSEAAGGRVQADEPLAGCLLPIAWPAPPTVRALMTTRGGAPAAAPLDGGFNLGLHVGDDAERVQRRRAQVTAALGATPHWLHQVHGAAVVDIHDPGSAAQPADAAFSTRPGRACVVLVADCLPVLLADRHGRVVAAAHAGWRGLAAGVIERTVEAMCSASSAAPADLLAWLGPSIGPRRFEVGDDVRDAFSADEAPHFRAHRRADGSSAWLGDLPALARARLAGAGVRQVDGGTWCTVEQASDFFSFRRERVTGRMAAAIALVG